MKRSEKTMLAVCDTIASGVMSYNSACRANAVAPRTFWGWIKASQGGDDAYLMDYLGERIQFAKAVNAARRMALHEMRGRMEQKSILGWDEVSTYQGQIVWQLDPRVVGWSEDEREAFGFRRDGLLEVDGRPVPVTIHHEPPVALQLRVAEMAFPKEYRPGLSTTVEVSGSVGVGIVKPLSGRPTVPPPPPMPQLTVLDDDDDDEPEEVATVDEAPESDISDTDPAEYNDDFEAAAPEPEKPEPERVIREPVPAPTGNPLIQPRGGRPLSALERDLLSRSKTVPDKVGPR